MGANAFYSSEARAVFSGDMGNFGLEMGGHEKEDRVRKVERMHLIADISKIKNFVGWEPNISLKDALINTAQYYK